MHLHQITDRPDLRLNVDRIMASELGLTQQDVSGSVLVSLSSTSQVSPNFWVNPANRVNYRVAVQTPEYRIHSMDTLLNTPIIRSQTRRDIADDAPTRPRRRTGMAGTAAAAAVAEQPGRCAPHCLAGERQPLQRAADLRCLRQCAGTRFGGRCRRRATSRRRRSSRDLPRGSSIAMRGQVETMNSSFTGLAAGLVFAVLLVYLLMVVNFQSWLDPFIILTALPGRAGGHRVDALRHADDVERAGADGRDHVHRRGHVEQHPDGDLRQRSAPRGRPTPIDAALVAGSDAPASRVDDGAGDGRSACCRCRSGWAKVANKTLRWAGPSSAA